MEPGPEKILALLNVFMELSEVVAVGFYLLSWLRI
jgi:hypothetical protein